MKKEAGAQIEGNAPPGMRDDTRYEMKEKSTIRLAVAADALVSPAAQDALGQAAEVIRSGGTVAFPTETVYGLGANALDAHAVDGIFLAKQRPAWDPLIVHVADASMVERIVLHATGMVQAKIDSLIAAFWPGPLTLLLPKQLIVPDAVTAGRPLVGVRMPAHPVARAFIAATGVPIAAPSANRFGHTSPTTAQHVLDDLDGRIDMVLDAGPAWCGVESTVIEVTEQEVLLYRPGALAVEEIEAVSGPVRRYQPSQAQYRKSRRPESLPSPGVDMRHYAPRAKVIPLEMEARSKEEGHVRWLRALAEQFMKRSKVGVMVPTGWSLPESFSGLCYDWGNWENSRELAQRLFAGLRYLDAAGVDVILCPLPPDAGLGTTIRDRLLKAARKE